MKNRFNEITEENRFYIIRTRTYDSGKTDYISMTTNTPENRHLHIKALGFEVCSAEKNVLRCTFPYNTLHFVLSGKGFFDGTPIESGGGFMVKKNNAVEYKPDVSAPWTYCWINFDGEIAQDLLDMAGLSPAKCIFISKSNLKIEKIIKSALNYDYSRTDVDMHLSAVLLEIFAHMIADKPDPFTNSSSSVMEERVRSGIEYINHHYTEKNCIENLAAEQKVNKRYLSRLFGLYSDCSPQAHLIRMRIDEAKRLLRTTSLQIGAIASKVGYDDVMQFSKIFKKHTGVSPTEYRKGTMEIVKKH